MSKRGVLALLAAMSLVGPVAALAQPAPGDRGPPPPPRFHHPHHRYHHRHLPPPPPRNDRGPR